GGGRHRHLRLLQRPARVHRAGAAALDGRRPGHGVRRGRPRQLRRQPVRGPAVPAHRVRAQPGHAQRRPVRALPRGPQGRGRAAGDRGRRLLHRRGQLQPVRALRPGRRVHRRRHGVLRRVRLRRDEHRGGGVDGLAEAHAQGDRLLAGDLHGALRAGLPGAHRHGQLPRHRRRGRVLRRVRRRGPALPRRDHRGGRDPGHPDGAVHLHDGRLAGRLRDEPRRAPARVGRADRPAHRLAEPDHLGPGRRLGPDRGLPADQRGRGADEHRHPARLRGGLHRRGRAPLPPPRPAALVQVPRHARRADHRGGVQPLADQLPGPGDLAALRPVVPARRDRVGGVRAPEVEAGPAAAGGGAV
ncbi:MAG: Uncharacterized amino acid permease, GabP family, partial [uncultured Pseudonocardia sp.]